MSIYEPLLMSPKNETRDMTLPQVFSATVQGSKITDYQIKIMKNSDGTVLFDSNKITLLSTLYNGETLVFTVSADTIKTERDLKWTLQVWNGSDTVTSRENFFNNYTKPTISLNSVTINTQSYTFIGNYSQAENIPAKQFKYTLYDSNQTEIDTSDWQFNGSVVWTFDGFISGNTYYVKCEVYDVNDIYTTSGLIQYNVSYVQPSVNLKPKVENDYENGYVKISFSGVFDNVGSSSGTISYVDDDSTGKALNLGSGATAMWNNLKIKDNFTDIFVWKPSSKEFTGRIKRIENTSTGKYFEIGIE